MQFRILLFCLLLAMLPARSWHHELFGQEVPKRAEPLRNAHAHNDYEHDLPLLDALELGFTSVEADVYPVDGELLVAHNLSDVAKGRTLDTLYLQPLQRLTKSSNGRVYPAGQSLTLLVDIKVDGATAYRLLDKLLSNYSEMVSQTVDGQYVEKAVTVIVSGDRPIKEMAASNPRYAGVDGRIADLESNESPSILPLISDNWSKHFTYRGQGEMSSAERQKLVEIVEKAHAKKRRVRFWGTPESELFWKELKSANVDLIGTDKLRQLATFLRE
ncbi:MAG: phosphatidylinositol-specific phospholipase C/glycerophosphodiester phosphodiesterase family protein [Pirellulaceae bacterium]|nr:phosphatidylinositol-specific phospholipase C/glycerophosphodiester phosphodiesterase family protein [Pirellulaceae bacterium]